MNHSQICAQVLAAASLVSLAAPAPARAETIRNFNVPAGTLADALIVLALQADISVAVTDPALRGIRVSGLRGRYAVRQALHRLLRGSGYDFVMVDAATVRLVKRPAKRATRSASPAKAALPPAPLPEPERPEIVVTATKQGLGLSSYPGSVALVELGAADAARYGARGTDLLLQELPNLASTNLGSGRNKIFIRGVADSSFNGVSQATISQYLGDSRLIYSAPDPDLALYDISRIEVLEGPQGTLYGAGTLGGIIRIVPNDPDVESFEAHVSGGILATGHGATGGDAAATVNLPVIRGTAALRVLGYRTVSPGYIDDALRDLSNVNRKSVTGLRATLRVTPGDGWTVDLGVLGQTNRSRDAQYSERGLDPLTRRSAIAQPFDNDYRMAFLRVEKQWDGIELVSATSYTDHSIDSNFDASEEPGESEALAYNDDMTVTLLAHETRLTGALGGTGRWVAGLSALRNVDRSERAIGPPEELDTIAHIRSTTVDTALFGEATFPLIPRVSVTLGGRLAYVKQEVELAGQASAEDFAPNRSEVRFLPTAAASWKPRGGMLVYARYQQGFRPGGIQVGGSGPSFTAERFRADDIRTIELGLRFGNSRSARFSGGLSLSWSRWNDIQADLVDPDGFPFAANIGSGRVANLAANLAWRPASWLALEAAGFINNSRLDRPAALYAAEADHDLPNVADRGWRLSARIDREISGATLAADATVRFVGDSILAIGAPLNLTQGSFYEVSAGARLGLGACGISIDVQNLLDTRGNRFSYGNPFSVGDGRQLNVIRPRSIRIGIDAHF